MPLFFRLTTVFTKNDCKIAETQRSWITGAQWRVGNLFGRCGVQRNSASKFAVSMCARSTRSEPHSIGSDSRRIDASLGHRYLSRLQRVQYSIPNKRLSPYWVQRKV